MVSDTKQLEESIAKKFSAQKVSSLSLHSSMTLAFPTGLCALAPHFLMLGTVLLERNCGSRQGQPSCLLVTLWSITGASSLKCLWRQSLCRKLSGGL